MTQEHRVRLSSRIQPEASLNTLLSGIILTGHDLVSELRDHVRVLAVVFLGIVVLIDREIILCERQASYQVFVMSLSTYTTKH